MGTKNINKINRNRDSSPAQNYYIWPNLPTAKQKAWVVKNRDVGSYFWLVNQKLMGPFLIFNLFTKISKHVWN